MFKWCLSIFAFTSMAVQANVIIAGTRIVYPSNQKQISVQLTNKGTVPALVQAWLDDGDEKADPKTLKLPFVITPPVSRIDAKKQQTLRVSYTGKKLAQDRETLFFFNLLDVPPKPSKAELAQNPNYLQFSVRSRLKFFFRPANLPYPVQDAYNKVAFRASGKQMIVENPTPYFITYSRLGVKQGNKRINVKKAGMVAPFSKASFDLTSAVSGGQVEWLVINDYGSRAKGISTLQ